MFVHRQNKPLDSLQIAMHDLEDSAARLRRAVQELQTLLRRLQQATTTLSQSFTSLETSLQNECPMDESDKQDFKKLQ